MSRAVRALGVEPGKSNAFSGALRGPVPSADADAGAHGFSEAFDIDAPTGALPYRRDAVLVEFRHDQLRMSYPQPLGTEVRQCLERAGIEWRGRPHLVRAATRHEPGVWQMCLRVKDARRVGRLLVSHLENAGRYELHHCMVASNWGVTRIFLDDDVE